jgi:predicted RNase H-like nuclease
MQFTKYTVIMALLVGFDSAWTSANSGALVGVLWGDDGTFHSLGAPQIVDYRQAEGVILKWQAEYVPTATVVLIDQPTIVKNAAGKRPVESIVSSPVSLRYGGMQPANTAKKDMFGNEAPIWMFLQRFGGPADPLTPIADTRVFETYPVLALIALGWILQDSRPTGRLPKYNPTRKRTFSISDWQYVCKRLSGAFGGRGLSGIAEWIEEAALKTSPSKHDQDCLDACLCLLVGICLAEQREGLMVGDLPTGYIVVPHNDQLYAELHARCNKTGRLLPDWVRTFKMDLSRIAGISAIGSSGEKGLCETGPREIASW